MTLIIFSPDFNTHLEHIEAVLIRLKEANLKLKVSKCTFAKTKIRFLGHVVSGEGIQIGPTKMRVVKEYPIPTDLKRLRMFLG